MKVKKYVKQYLQTYKQHSLKQSTYDSYIGLIQHIPEDWELKKIDIKDVQKLVNKLARKGKSRSTIKHVCVVLNMALKRAYLEGKTKKMFNIEFIELPQNDAKKVNALPRAEQMLIISRQKDSTYGDLFCFLLYTGVRVGEALALNWIDYNPLDRTIRVNKTLYRNELQAAKTKSSDREIPLSDVTVELLENRRRGDGKSNVPIFTTSLGKRCNISTISKAWARFLDLIGIPHCGLHALRHTYASNALRAGVNPKIVSKLLGHSSVQVTLDIYTDVYKPQLAAAAEQINQSIFDMLD